MAKVFRTPLDDIIARHDISTLAGFRACLEAAIGAYDTEVLNEPRCAKSGEELSPVCPNGDSYNELAALVALISVRSQILTS